MLSNTQAFSPDNSIFSVLGGNPSLLSIVAEIESISDHRGEHLKIPVYWSGSGSSKTSTAISTPRVCLLNIILC